MVELMRHLVVLITVILSSLYLIIRFKKMDVDDVNDNSSLIANN
jgi:hypothetical protein